MQLVGTAASEGTRKGSFRKENDWMRLDGRRAPLNLQLQEASLGSFWQNKESNTT